MKMALNKPTELKGDQHILQCPLTVGTWENDNLILQFFCLLFELLKLIFNNSCLLYTSRCV